MLRSSRTSASKNSSLSRIIASRRPSSNVGNSFGSGDDEVQLPQRQPLVGEVVQERRRLRVLEHPPDLGRQILPQLPLCRQGEQLVVGHAVPEEVREPAGQLVLVDRVGRAGRQVRRVELDAEEEVRRDQHAVQRRPDAQFEPLPLLLGRVVEGQAPLDLVGLHRAAEGAGGEPGDDLAGRLARRQARLVRHQPRVRPRETPAAAGRTARRPRRPSGAARASRRPGSLGFRNARPTRPVPGFTRSFASIAAGLSAVALTSNSFTSLPITRSITAHRLVAEPGRRPTSHRMR